MNITIKDNNTFKVYMSNLDKSKLDYKKLTIFFLSLLTFAALLLKFHLLFKISINQDEFHYLSLVYEYLHGSLTQSLNSFHVHLFTWLSVFGLNEVDQVIGARIVMYLLFLCTCRYIFLIGRYYFDTASALFSILCYISFASTIVNGANFRHDTFSIFLFTLAVYHFLVKKESYISNFLAGLAMAFAFMFTIKSAIHMTVFGGLVFIRFFLSSNFHKTIIPISIFLLAFLIGYIIIYEFHISTIANLANANYIQTTYKAFSTFVLFDRFFPQFKLFKFLLGENIIIWAFLTFGFIFSAYDTLKRKNYPTSIYLLPLIFPLFSLLIYRNAFSYFYVFITAAATIFCGYMFWKLTEIIKIKSKIICFMLIVIIGGVIFKDFISHYSAFCQNQTEAQHQTLDVIHTMFQDPVPYIDGCSMVSSFPNVGFFMSSAGMEPYLRGGKPIIEKLLDKKMPLFLLANVPHLNLHFDDPAKSYTNLAFREEDWHTLKSYFIHHWGVIWVVGKQFEFGSEFENYKFKITVPGVYTLEGDEKVLIDDRMINAGDTVNLETGNHSIRNQGTPCLINLRWGDHLYRPAEKPISTPIFIGPFL